MIGKAHPLFTLFLIALLAACGGSNAPGEATATPLAALSAEERRQFAPGTFENPLQIVIVAPNTVSVRVGQILVEALGVSSGEVRDQATLRDDLGAPDDLASLVQPVSDTFGVSLTEADAESLQTVVDLVRFIQNRVADRLETVILDRTSIPVDVIVAENPGQARTSLCQPEPRIVSIVWLDGLTYTTARDCGDVALQIAASAYNAVPLDDAAPEALDVMVQVEFTPEFTAEATHAVDATPAATASPIPEVLEDATPEPTPEVTAALPPADLSTQTAALIIVNRRVGSSMEALRGRVFCRLGLDDVDTWLLPSLMLRRVNTDALTDFAAVVDYPTTGSLLRAVAEGDCDGTGVSESTYEAIDDSALLADLRIASTSPPLPLKVMMYPIEVELGVRLTISELFINLGADAELSRTLYWLIGQDSIVEVTEEELAYVQAFEDFVRVDLDQLGG
jgi:acyl carrier protein